MSKRRRKKPRKVFPAKFNARRVNVGQGVRTFLTSPKTGEIKGHFAEVFQYRHRGTNSVFDPWLEAVFKGVQNTSPERQAALDKRVELRKERGRFVLSKLDGYNDAVLEQESWRRQNVKQFHYKIILKTRYREVRLYISRDEYFIVEEDTILCLLRRSMPYGDMLRAEAAYKNKKIVWVERLELPTPPE